MIKLTQILFWPVCYFGGGGGAGGDQLAFQKQQIAEQQAIKDQINRMFGYGEVGVPNEPTTADFTKIVKPKPQLNAYGQPVADSNFASGGAFPNWVTGQQNRQTGPQSVFDQPGFDAAKAAREGAIATNTGVANVRAGREELYKSVGQDIFNQKAQQLSEQEIPARRNLSFQLARQGLTRGSADIDQNAEIQKDIDRTLTQIGGAAEGGSAELRQSDEVARLNLLDRINAGLDQSSAITSAMNQLNNAKDSILSSQQQQNLGDVFSNIALLNTSVNKGAAQGRGELAFRQAFGAPTPGTGGYGTQSSQGRVTT